MSNSNVIPSNLLTDNPVTASSTHIVSISEENLTKRPRLETVNNLVYAKHQFQTEELLTLRIKDFVSLVITKDMNYRKINNKEYGNVNFEVSTGSTKQKHTKSAHIRLGIALVRYIVDKHADKINLLKRLNPQLPSPSSPEYAKISRAAGQAAEEVETLFIATISEAHFSKSQLNEVAKAKQIKEWGVTPKHFGVWIARFEKCKSHNLFPI